MMKRRIFLVILVFILGMATSYRSLYERPKKELNAIYAAVDRGDLESLKSLLKRSPEDTNPLIKGLFEGKESVIEKALDFNHFHIIKWYYENSRSDINQELLKAVLTGNRVQFQKLLQPVLDYNGVHKSWPNQYEPSTLA